MTATLRDADVADHAAPIPAEPTDHSSDPATSWWTNHAKEVWQARNPQASWADAASYPVLPASRLRGWFTLRGQTWALAAALWQHGRQTGHRGTHPSGVGARGTLEVVARPGIPEHDFFVPGRRFPVRVRHANGSFFDDAACSVRGCAIKLADDAFDSPLDLMLNSGSQGPLWSTASFLHYTRYRLKCDAEKGDFEPQAKLMDETPAFLVAWNEGVRFAPDCFSDLTYHAQIVYPFVGKDGVLRYLRFRLRRPDLARESGLGSPERQRTAWDMRRDPADDRPLDYARVELARRVRAGGVRYVLQTQLRDPAPDDTTELFHLNRPWDTRRWPWTDLAVLSLDELLGAADTEAMRFAIGHQPASLGVFRAPSGEDYRSVAWARMTLYWASQLGRRRGPSGPPKNPYA